MGKNMVNGYGPPPKARSPRNWSKRGLIKKEIEVLQGMTADKPTVARLQKLHRMLAKKR